MHDTGLFDSVYEALVGWLGIQLEAGKLGELDWIERPHQSLRQRHPHPALRRLIRCLDNYFTNASLPEIPWLLGHEGVY